MILNKLLKFDYIKTLKTVFNKLIKPLTLVKHKYFITILGLAEKNKTLI